MNKATRTRFKLEEAKLFLAHLEEHWRHLPQVEFYLSAFVSAARSVTWVMKYEYGRKAGWHAWFDAKKPSNQVRELLRKMNDVRVRSTKSEPVRTRTTARVTIPPEQVTPEVERLLRPGTDAKVHLEPTDSSNTEAYVVVDGRVLAKAKLEHAEHEIPEFEGRDAKDVCAEYLHELEALVTECEAKFGPYALRDR